MTETVPVFVIPDAVAAATMAHLRSKGLEEEEGVVLWRGTFSPPTVTGVIVPEQETDRGRFIVPLRERQRIARLLAGTGEMIVVQVHSHPEAAFHSPIDDEEAIPRRVGAYSLVVPDYGARATVLDRAALFELREDGSWAEVPVALFALTPSPKARGLRWLIDTLKRFVRSRT
jgi:Prokaryotic homologs of the JAB domain